MGNANQQAPTAYQPQYSAANDQAFQQGNNQLASQGQALYSQVAPQFSQIAQGVASNPYYGQAQQGAQQVAAYGQPVAAGQFAGASQDYGYGQTAAAAGQQGYAQAQSAINNPAMSAGINAAPGVLYQGLNNANQSYGQSQQALGNVNAENNILLNAGLQTLNTAYDPQQALYNQQYQQMTQQANAANAQNGVAGSPFAAGLAAQDQQNFNIAWQNAQLGRQEGALSAFGSAANTATGNTNSTLSTGANDYTGLSSGAQSNYSGLTSNYANNLSSLISAGSSALDNGLNTGVGANTAASTLGNQGLQTVSSTSQDPSSIYLAQQQAALQALQAQVQGSNAAAGQQQQSVANNNTYINTGTTAANSAANTAQTNANTTSNFIGNLLGGASTVASFLL
jgi:hypothetical protein